LLCHELVGELHGKIRVGQLDQLSIGAAALERFGRRTSARKGVIAPSIGGNEVFEMRRKVRQFDTRGAHAHQEDIGGVARVEHRVRSARAIADERDIELLVSEDLPKVSGRCYGRRNGGNKKRSQLTRSGR
jgi:hypothetical protein